MHRRIHTDPYSTSRKHLYPDSHSNPYTNRRRSYSDVGTSHPYTRRRRLYVTQLLVLRTRRSRNSSMLFSRADM
jgi:hypothetical protein